MEEVFLFGKFKDQKEITDEYDNKERFEILFNNFINEVYEEKDTIKIIYNSYKKNILNFEKTIGKSAIYFDQQRIIELMRAIPSNSITTKERVFYILQNMFLWAMNKNYISINQIAALDKDELCKVNSKVLQSQFITIKKLVDECHQAKVKGSSVGECLCVLLGRYGVSSGDIVNLKWDDLDRENKLLYIQDKEIYIPIDDLLINWIDRAKEETMHNNVELIDTGYIIKPNKNMSDLIVSEEGYYNMVLRFFKLANIRRVSSKSLNNMRAMDFLLERRKQGKLKSEDIKNIYYSILNPKGSIGSYNTLSRYYTSLTGDEIVLMKDIRKFKEDEDSIGTVEKIKLELGYEE